MNNKIINQISFERNDDFEKISVSLDEFAIEHVTESYESLENILTNILKRYVQPIIC